VSAPVLALVTKAPEDPEQRRAWVTAMTRLQIAMWIDGTFACPQCRKVYESVDDFLAREPRFAGKDDSGLLRAVDDACWPAWEASQ
jgi:hypothetical protein